MTTAGPRWWQVAAIYQVYPRSFQDSDGDGVGDLPGIIRRLDYLRDLGVGAIWLSPFYPSPMADFGYDISDYQAVDPVFGTLADFDHLLAEAHARGLKVVLDFVPNHTSDRHPWFAASRSSRQNPWRDWYVWRDPGPDGGPPTNWITSTGQPAWTWDEASGQFYYHRFLPEQPDLNWRNPDVLAAMQDVLRFWLARGVDGFRVDAATSLVEDELLRPDPPGDEPDSSGPNRLDHVFTCDRPETHDVIARLRETFAGHPDAVLIGEAHLPLARIMGYYGRADRRGFHLPFNFTFLHTPWTVRSLEAAIDQYMILLPDGAWPNWVLGNHDESRIATRIGVAQARLAALLSLTLRGTPFIYNGEELGLTDVPIAADGRRDSQGLRGGQGRDPQRTPMPWDDGPGMGFTTGTPWLPMGRRQADTVAAQGADPRSFLSLYRALLALRRREPALSIGDHRPLPQGVDVLAFERSHAGRRLVVALNLAEVERPFAFDGSAELLLSSHLDREPGALGALTLRPQEGVVLAHPGAA